MLKLFSRKQKGFTLIELLVVISIIGILSSIVLVSMGGARAKARDARRQSDMRQIGSACELYYSDVAHDEYPQYANYTAAQAGGIDSYMPASAIPSDPGSNTYYWADNTDSGCNDAQKFCVWVENDDGGIFFAASHKGARMDLTTAPSALASPLTACDCW